MAYGEIRRPNEALAAALLEADPAKLDCAKARYPADDDFFVGDDDDGDHEGEEGEEF